jgi:hypothetical protein
VVQADGGGGVHACGWGPHPCQFQVDLIGAGAERRDAMVFTNLKIYVVATGLLIMIFIYLKTYIVVTGLLMSVGPLLLWCAAVIGQPRPSLPCDHCSDGIVAMNH